jgi:hypothetical protein
MMDLGKYSPNTVRYEDWISSILNRLRHVRRRAGRLAGLLVLPAAAYQSRYICIPPTQGHGCLSIGPMEAVIAEGA